MALTVLNRGWCLNSSRTKNQDGMVYPGAGEGAVAIPGIMQIMHQTDRPHLPANCSICRAFDEWMDSIPGGVPVEDVDAFFGKLDEEK